MCMIIESIQKQAWDQPKSKRLYFPVAERRNYNSQVKGCIWGDWQHVKAQLCHFCDTCQDISPTIYENTASDQWTNDTMETLETWKNS